MNALRHSAFKLPACLLVVIAVLTGLAFRATAESGASGKSTSVAPAATATTSASSSQPASGEPAPIVIQRQSLHLRSPEKYRVPIQLEPIKSVRLAARYDAAVKSVKAQPGDTLDSGGDAIHLDATEQRLVLDRAKALLKLAEIESRSAAQQPAERREAAEAKLTAAKADLDLATFKLEQGILRAPFKADVFRIDVAEGQVVRAGEPLMTIGDTSSMRAEVPVDRNAVKPGQSIELKIEEAAIPAQVTSVLPLSSQFESLRELLPSAASAIVVFPNTDRKLKAGQTVFSPIVPRDPVAEVPNGAIGNVPDGTHKVQVLRDNVVRDVRIVTLATVGTDRSFIAGPFESRDEVIVSTSQPLPDGTAVTPGKGAASSSTTGSAGETKPSGSRPTLPGTTPATPAKKTGF